MTTPITNRQRNTRRTLCVAVPIAAGIVALLLLRGCGRDPEPEPTPTAKEALFVPADLARLKGLDRDGVLEYCRTQIRPANYEGILRGPHGALWACEANAWDRVLLAAAALEGMKIEARVVPGDPPRVAFKDGSRWTTVRFDAPGDAEQADQPPADSIVLADLPTQRPDLFHTIQPVLVLEREGDNVARISPTTPGRVANWVDQPVVLQTVAEGEDVRYALMVGDLKSA